MFKNVFIGVTLTTLIFAAQAFGHTPLCSCWDEGDSTITCEGGFSDGSSAQGVIMYVKDKEGKTIQKGQMNEFSEFSFKKPHGNYTVVFDAGEGHQIKVNGKEIVE